MAGGLFDFNLSPDDKSSLFQGLLAGAGAALASRGTPLQAAGQGLLGGVQGYAGGQQLAAQSAWRNMQAENARTLAEGRRLEQDKAARQQGLLAQDPSTWNVGALASAGFSPEQINGYLNAGKSKVTTYKEVRQPDGSVKLIGLDDYGAQVDTGATPWEKPQAINLGDQFGSFDPVSNAVQPLAPIAISPDARLSADTARRGQAITLRGQDLTDARARESNSIQARATRGAPSGYRWAADGVTLEPIPGGPATKDKAPTEYQGKAGMFGARAAESDRILRELEGQYSPAALNAATGAANFPLLGGPLGMIANTALPATAQRVDQAQRDFVNAVLRQESGAAISQSEFDNARKQYFPQPGDSKAVIDQKSRNRQTVIQGFKANAGPVADQVRPAQAGASNGWGIQRVN